MANNGEIIIKFEGEIDSVKKVDPTEEKKKKDSLLETTLSVIVMKKALNMVKKISVDEVKYQLNRYYMFTDNYLGQQDTQFALQSIGEVTSFGLSMGVAIKAGLKYGGASGAVALASLVAVGEGLSKFIENNRKINEEKLNLRKMDTELEFNRQRAGFSLTAGSIGENR